MAEIKNEGTTHVAIHVDCEVEDSQSGIQVLATRVLTIAAGATVSVKFNDSSDSSKVTPGLATATVTAQEDPDVGSNN